MSRSCRKGSERVSQRSHSNDRNRKDAIVGSTRKSAASAKPIRKRGTVEVTKASATKKAKPGVEKDWAGLPTSPEIKKWRRIWWVLLLGGIGAVVLGYVEPTLQASESAQWIIVMLVLVASMTAVAIDLVIIRRLRKQLIEAQGKKLSKKEQRHVKGEQESKVSGKGKA